MKNLQLTYSFETPEALRAHLDLVTRSDGDVSDALTRLGAAPVAADVLADRSAVDGDGMPYDAAVHSDPPSFTAKGLWKAQRGKAAEADAARAAFKARGGNIAAPAPLAMPVAAPLAMPVAAPLAMPVAAPVVTIETVYAETAAAMDRGIHPDRMVAIYDEIGLTDLVQFNTNESLRAAYVAKVRALTV